MHNNLQLLAFAFRPPLFPSARFTKFWRKKQQINSHFGLFLKKTYYTKHIFFTTQEYIHRRFSFFLVENRTKKKKKLPGFRIFFGPLLELLSWWQKKYKKKKLKKQLEVQHGWSYKNIFLGSCNLNNRLVQLIQYLRHYSNLFTSFFFNRCEHNYKLTPYIAEPLNTISNLSFVLFGIVGGHE